MTNANSNRSTDHIPFGKPIYWREGLFLQPHHFQWQDQFYQSLIHPLSRYLQPSMWGTAQISIHKESLSNYVFNIQQGEFRFRDMTHVKYPGNAVLESRNFEKSWKDKGKPFTVYLGIRKLSHIGRNVSDAQCYESFTMVPTRFVADRQPENLADLYEGSESLAIERMQYVLKLLWEDEKNRIGDYEVIPIAQLEYIKGQIVLSPDFIPPVLSIFSSHALTENIKTVSALITSTSNRLEANKKDRGVHTAEFGTKDMVFLLTLRTLNRFSPVLRHMLGKGNAVHPWSIYGILCQLIGELSTFSSKINLVYIRKDNPFYLIDYDHEELSRCFKRVKTILSKLMADIAADPEYVAPFEFDGSYYTVQLAPKLLNGRRRYYLVIETDAELELVKKEMESLAKLSTQRYISLLVSQSLPGLKIKYIEHPPPELPRRNAGIYFAVNTKGRMWQKVIEEKNLALCWDNSPADAKIELMVAGRDD